MTTTKSNHVFNTAGKTRPILYSSEMVLALLDQRKTQTRRTNGLEIINENPDLWQIAPTEMVVIDGHFWAGFRNKETQKIKWTKCPYGAAHDLLWVRENLNQHGESGLEYAADREWIDEALIPDDYGPYGGSFSHRTIPCIHMPKWACRIFLRIKSIRVERLQDISESDAAAEGVRLFPSAGYSDYGMTAGMRDVLTAKESFLFLWQSINGVSSTISNPWVWVVGFHDRDRKNDLFPKSR